MSKHLLTEYFELCPNGSCHDLLTEQEKRMIKEHGALFLTGIIQAADTMNGNGRVYPLNTLQREVEKYSTLIKENRAVGELDHPDDSVINLKNVSHKVTGCWWDGNNVMGKIQVLDTPSGGILKALVGGGVKLGISSRGMGSVTEQQGKTLVEDDYQLICFDIVQEPSTPSAYLVNETENSGGNRLFENKKRKINHLLDDILR